MPPSLFSANGERGEKDSVKTAHRVKLTLLVWYLMVPPTLIHNSLPVDLRAPLSEWRLFSTFESAAECEQGLIAFYNAAKSELIKNEGNESDRIRYYQLENSQCIANGDLRLKLK
jgi:hypothetical protein